MLKRFLFFSFFSFFNFTALQTIANKNAFLQMLLKHSEVTLLYGILGPLISNNVIKIEVMFKINCISL